jgi:hypothetical protein
MSEIKVNKISPRAACGTVQLGDSGDTFTIPAGATINNQGTATNFGATGSASWVTTVKTSGFTAVAGEGYFVNTTSGPISVNLPAGTAGAVVAIKDYAGTFDTNALTLVQNGSDKIGGSTVNATLQTEGIAVTLVFIDSTQGWLVTDSGLQDEAPTAQYVTATGGTIITCGDHKIHVFTGPGTLCVSCAGNASGSNKVSYMVVAGGGAGGATNRQSRPGSAAGAGGFREGKAPAFESYTASPLVAADGLTVPATSYPITVGAGGTGGAGVNGPSSSGANSIFSSITSAGGGAGASPGGCEHAAGGSGGAARAGGPAGKAGNTPPVSPPQGNAGGNGGPCGVNFATGGGGGATAAGTTAASSCAAGAGGFGAGTAITTSACYGTPGPSGSLRYYAGGGGGSVWGPSGGAAGGGYGGGANGQNGNPYANGIAGTTNTGGGGSGGTGGPGYPSCNVSGGNGGSGIVIIRYKFQN